MRVQTSAVQRKPPFASGSSGSRPPPEIGQSDSTPAFFDPFSTFTETADDHIQFVSARVLVGSATMGVKIAGLKPELVGSNGAFCHVGVSGPRLLPASRRAGEAPGQAREREREPLRRVVAAPHPPSPEGASAGQND